MTNDIAEVRHNWTMEEVAEIYNSPVLELIFRGASVHHQYQTNNEIQVCTLLSIKTGGCPEDCAYCGQAARYHTDITVQALMSKETVLEYARTAKEGGSSRFCMAAAWREVRDNRDFDRVLDMVKDINEMGLEVCCTLGMLNEEQAQRLQEAGLYAYNHNIDSSEGYYKNIISTRTFDDRLKTLDNVRKAGMTVCCGGIIGLGETDDDRISMLHTLATMPVHPESVPVNALARVQGTPMADQPRVPVWDMVRMIATARILMPRSVVRLSAGRAEMSQEEQALCFLAGANSIFSSEHEKLLVTPNPNINKDKEMLNLLGLTIKKSATEKAATV
ncbi:MAG TPA: biotin synthase BioB [Chitinophaga sp.]|uniref:biotin synthase BioB n=1 Tax=Chitinophaga sp. TaxID=1869181 RepID=UPI002BC64B3D|nr:biotin synthase BioB [Chitinophaga sp.]HVI44380.1 biotin synthase BioB [Chitinophaga sp.]